MGGKGKKKKKENIPVTIVLGSRGKSFTKKSRLPTQATGQQRRAHTHTQREREKEGLWPIGDVELRDARGHEPARTFLFSERVGTLGGGTTCWSVVL